MIFKEHTVKWQNLFNEHTHHSTLIFIGSVWLFHTHWAFPKRILLTITTTVTLGPLPLSLLNHSPLHFTVTPMVISIPQEWDCGHFHFMPGWYHSADALQVCPFPQMGLLPFKLLYNKPFYTCTLIVIILKSRTAQIVTEISKNHSNFQFA